MPDSQTVPTATVGGKERLKTKTDAPSRRRRWHGVVGIVLVVLVIAIALIAAVARGLLPSWASADTRKVAAAAIFAGSYLALAIGKVPGLSIDRAGVALVGAGLMVASGALSLEEAYKAIDLNTPSRCCSA